MEIQPICKSITFHLGVTYFSNEEIKFDVCRLAEIMKSVGSAWQKKISITKGLLNSFIFKYVCQYLVKDLTRQNLFKCYFIISFRRTNDFGRKTGQEEHIFL